MPMNRFLKDEMPETNNDHNNLETLNIAENSLFAQFMSVLPDELS